MRDKTGINRPVRLEGGITGGRGDVNVLKGVAKNPVPNPILAAVRKLREGKKEEMESLLDSNSEEK